MQSEMDPWSLAVICSSIPLTGIVCFAIVETKCHDHACLKKCTFTTWPFFFPLFFHFTLYSLNCGLIFFLYSRMKECALLE